MLSLSSAWEPLGDLLRTLGDVWAPLGNSLATPWEPPGEPSWGPRSTSGTAAEDRTQNEVELLTVLEGHFGAIFVLALEWFLMSFLWMPRVRFQTPHLAHIGYLRAGLG